MWTNWQFWRDATWRAFRTFCQTLAALLGGQAVNVLAAPWASMLGVSGTAALVSLLMSVDRERAVAGPVAALAEPTTATFPAVQAYAQEYDPAPDQVDLRTAATLLSGPPAYGCGDSVR